jgi:hypothetical protein
LLARLLEQLLQQEVPAFTAFRGDDGRQGIHPLARFLRVCVVGGRAEHVVGLCGHVFVSWVREFSTGCPHAAGVSHNSGVISNGAAQFHNMNYLGRHLSCVR